MVLSEFLRKTFAEPKSRVTQAGQAVLEYILVLIIVVSILLGILFQFNDAFKNFLDTYFGDYIACLLETGELPSLGGDGPNQGECSAPFMNFNLAGGQSLDNGGSGGGAAGSSAPNQQGGGGEGDGGGSGDDSTTPGSRMRPSVVTSSGSPTNAERSSGAGSQRPGRTAYRGNEQGANREAGFDAGTGDSGSAGRGGRTIVRRRIIDLGEEYLSEEEKKKQERDRAKTQTIKKKGGIRSLRQARFPLEVPQPRALATDIDAKGFNFAQFLKFLIIAAILIAIFIFLGGQAMQIKKSWQKSE
jgi:hypothetical protein